MLAALADLGAPRDGVPGHFGPFDVRFVCHSVSYQAALLACARQMRGDLESDLAALLVPRGEAQGVHRGIVRIIENHRLLYYVREYRPQPIEEVLQNLVRAHDLGD